MKERGESEKEREPPQISEKQREGEAAGHSTHFFSGGDACASSSPQKKQQVKLTAQTAKQSKNDRQHGTKQPLFFYSTSRNTER